MAYIKVKGAYGRDYKTAKAVKEDIKNGKDFEQTSMFATGGRYVGALDLQKGDVLEVRFDQNRKVTTYKVTGKESLPKPVTTTTDTDKATTVTIHQTMEQAEEALYEGVWYPECTCGVSRCMEPDASGFTCDGCGNKVKLYPII